MLEPLCATGTERLAEDRPAWVSTLKKNLIDSGIYEVFLGLGAIQGDTP